VLELLKVRDLHMRDSENVTTYGGQNLQKLAAALTEEERKYTVASLCIHIEQFDGDKKQ
jgi:hypothetical protein